MRISKAAPLVLLLGAGCVGLDDSADAPRQVQVTADQVVITGPDGFCVDPASTRSEGDTGFVILGNCAAISGSDRAPQPNIPAVLTAAVSGRTDAGQITGNLATLETFLRSEEGRQLLSRSGAADHVEILDTQVVGGMLFVHARDTSAGALAGVATDYWRAYLDIGPRLATLTVLALADRDVSDAAALAALSAFAQSVAAANPNASIGPQAAGDPAPPPFTDGLLRRIFR